MATESRVCKERNSARKNPVPRDSFQKIVEQFETVGNRYFEENFIKITETANVEKIWLEIKNFHPIALRTQEKRQTTQSERHEIEKILRKEIGITLKQSRDIPFSELDQIKKNILTSNISIGEISKEFQAQLSKIRIKYRTYFYDFCYFKNGGLGISSGRAGKRTDR